MSKHYAIVGTGIAGMSAAYQLVKKGHQVTVFEANDYIGGHTHTVTVNGTPVDTGFIVYNRETYPNLIKLFKELEVPTTDTEMSFSVQYRPTGLEYSGTSFNHLFAQRKNIFSPRYLRFLMQVNRFNQQCLEVLESDEFLEMTIEEYFAKRKIGQMCFDKYLVPMSAAIWSTPPDKIKDFPIVAMVRFFKNHGLLGMNTHYQWKTVIGGSWNYRDRLIASFKDSIRTQSPVIKVARDEEKQKVLVSVGGKNPETLSFDGAIMAAHADQTYQMIKEDATDLENRLLKVFRYQENDTILHTDASVMPKTKLTWSSWNVSVTKKQLAVTYYMNRLQPLETEQDYFVTLNARDSIDPKKILREFTYHHPVFDLPAIMAQRELGKLNKQPGGIYYCGSYFANGFHEDALKSSIEMCQEIFKREEFESL